MSYLKFHSDQLFDGYRFRDQHEVLITDHNGVVEGIVPMEDAGDDVQHFEGIICPGFVNAHCHLELSYLKNIIPRHTGLVDFISQVMQGRNAAAELIQEAIVEAENEMIANGIVAVGDICNTTHTIAQKQKGRLVYQNLIEVAGFVPAAAQNRFDAMAEVADAFYQSFPHNTSIVPHAPYSVSEPLFELVRDFPGNKIFSIHNQESAQENLFFKDKQGEFLNLYNNIGVDLSFFQATGKGSIDYYVGKVAKDINTLFVHNTFTAKEDIDNIALQLKNSYFCLCPSANLYIENQLPDIDLFRHFNGGNNVVIGTDSLASNSSLNILQELSVIENIYPSIAIEELLKWATINGAKAIYVDNLLGSFEKYKKPGVIKIGCKKYSSKSLDNSTIEVFL